MFSIGTAALFLPVIQVVYLLTGVQYNLIYFQQQKTYLFTEKFCFSEGTLFQILVWNNYCVYESWKKFRIRHW